MVFVLLIRLGRIIDFYLFHESSCGEAFSMEQRVAYA